ncbi:MAG: CoA transferase [Chloroflexi bacterium]|nr:CoA transferase [Chloroflexota bacterium]
MGAFDGIKVLELATGITGPYVAMLLADQGAEVVKAEGREGDPAKGTAGSLVWNRGKRSIKLSFEAPEAEQVVRKLLSWCDVLITDFDSPQSKAPRLDHERLLESYPRLIICSISPWGESGPYAHKPGSAQLVSAYSGATATQASFSGDPVYRVMPFASFETAFIGACGVTAALLYRRRSGRGQKLELSLLRDGSLAGLWGETVTRAIALLTTPFGHAPTYRIYQTRDGWIQIAAGNPTFCGKLFIAMGREELISDPRFVNLPWGLASLEDRKALEEIIGRWVSQFTNDGVLALLEQNDIPCGPVRTAEEFASHPQVVHSGMMVELEDPSVGKVEQMGILVALLGNPGKIRRPCPLLGQHTKEVLSELGYSEAQVSDLQSSGVI